MNVLITNDDGYDSDGIQILGSVLKKAGHTVYMVAPSENRSAISSGITMTRRLDIKNVGDRYWSCSGTPADCIITGLKSNLIEESVDVILSGINDGGNIGTDIIYSGTCAAARQGALYGIPSIALSISFVHGNAEKRGCFERLPQFAAKNLPSLVLLAGKNGCASFVNVNAFSFSSWNGVRLTGSLAVRHYDDSVEIVHKPDGDGMQSLFYGKEPLSSGTQDSDYSVCAEGYISVSGVMVEPVHSELIDGISFSL